MQGLISWEFCVFQEGGESFATRNPMSWAVRDAPSVSCNDAPDLVLQITGAQWLQKLRFGGIFLSPSLSLLSVFLFRGSLRFGILQGSEISRLRHNLHNHPPATPPPRRMPALPRSSPPSVQIGSLGLLEGRTAPSPSKKSPGPWGNQSSFNAAAKDFIKGNILTAADVKRRRKRCVCVCMPECWGITNSRLRSGGPSHAWQPYGGGGP